MLHNFFRIKMPYGIAKNEDGQWFAFNREYLPIGFNNTNFKNKFPINSTSELPIHTKYKKLTEALLKEIAGDEKGAIVRNENNKIIKVFLYNDNTNPVNQSKNDSTMWDNYFKKLMLLSKLERE